MQVNEGPCLTFSEIESIYFFLGDEVKTVSEFATTQRGKQVPEHACTYHVDVSDENSIESFMQKCFRMIEFLEKNAFDDVAVA